MQPAAPVVTPKPSELKMISQGGTEPKTETAVPTAPGAATPSEHPAVVMNTSTPVVSPQTSNFQTAPTLPAVPVQTDPGNTRNGEASAPDVAIDADNGDPEYRTWSLGSGATIAAKFYGMSNGRAVMIKKDGTHVPVPLGSLSLQDQNWIKGHPVSNGPSALPRPSTSPQVASRLEPSPSQSFAGDSYKSGNAAPESSPADESSVPSLAPNRSVTQGPTPHAMPAAEHRRVVRSAITRDALDQKRREHTSWNVSVIVKKPTFHKQTSIGMSAPGASHQGTSTSHGGYTTYTSVRQKRPLLAELFSYDGDTVVLQDRDDDGKIRQATFTYKDFSSDDQKFLIEYRNMQRRVR